MIYCFDIDGTICTTTEGEYERAEPYSDVIAAVNALYDEGHRIILHTARGSTTGISWRELTENQLWKWGVKYHELSFGKPTADVYIDDKAMNMAEWKTKLSLENIAFTPASRAYEDQPVLKTPRYLDVTYSPTRVPYGIYPYLLAQWLLKHVYKKAGVLIDLGCGRGEHLAAFARLGFDVAGVDISPYAKELANYYRAEVADLERDRLPFPANSFDFAFSKSVIEHMRHPTRLLSLAFEALRPGGTAVIMTPSWAHTYWGPFFVDHTHVTPFTAPSLADALSLVGFESVSVSYFYQLPFLWRYPFLKPFVWAVAALPLPYRPHTTAPWPEKVNKVIRFSKEVMLLGVAKRPVR